MSKMVFAIGLCLLIITTGAFAGAFSIAGNWQLLTNNTASEPRDKLKATTTTMEINLEAHPGETYRVDYIQDASGKFSGQLIGDPMVVIQGRMAKPDLFGIAVEIRHTAKNERKSYRLKAKRIK